MKKFIIFLLICFLLILPQTLSEECDYQATIYLDIEAYEGSLYGSSFKTSKYQFPDFKESTFLVIKNITIINEGNCDLPSTNLFIQLKYLDDLFERNVDNVQYPDFYFGLKSGKLEIPPIPVNSSYQIYNKWDCCLFYLTDSFGIEINLIPFSVEKIGKWEIVGEITDIEGIKNIRYGFLVDGSYQTNFNVLSRYDTMILERAEEETFFTRLGIIVALIIALISIILSGLHYHFRNIREDSIHKKNQIGFLENILLRIDVLLKDLHGFEEEIIDNKNPYCTYDMKYINSDLLQVNIDYEINNKKTNKIKELLFFVDDKVKLINGYNKRAENAGAYQYLIEAIKIIEEQLFEKLFELEREIEIIKNP